MPERIRHQTQSKNIKGQQVKVTLGPSHDVPVLFATHLLVNFTGSEFIVNVVAAVQDPLLEIPKTPATTVEAKVLGRFSFSVAQWASISQSIEDQIKRLQDQGFFELTPVAPASEVEAV